MGGRGASAPRGGTGGIGGFASNALGFQRYDSLRDALGSQGNSRSMADAMLNSNPHYDKTHTYREFTENCQRCVVAYEARRRGYNVTAQPTFEGDRAGAPAYVNPKTGIRNSYWMGYFQGAKPTSVGGSTGSASQRALENKMAEFGEGSRGIMQVRWKGGGGHVINVERRNGRTYYNDAQAGVRYNPKSLFNAIDPTKTQLTRTDNLRLSERAKNAVTKDNW